MIAEGINLDLRCWGCMWFHDECEGTEPCDDEELFCFVADPCIVGDDKAARDEMMMF